MSIKDYINKVIEGKSENILKDFPDNSIDSVVTDAPYGLGRHPAKLIKEVLNQWVIGNDDYIPAVKGFRGLTWDSFVPPPSLWKEVFRVMKPGAIALIFAGNRTADLMSLSLRLAGFEMKDTIIYTYLTGILKPTDISKAIDKKLGLADKRGYIKTTGGLAGGTGNSIHRYTGRQLSSKGYSTTAKLFEGYRSNLRPCYEPIIVVSKPIDSDYATNAERWGVAGFNTNEGGIIDNKGKKRYPVNQIWSKDYAQYKNREEGKDVSKSIKVVEEESNYINVYSVKPSIKERTLSDGIINSHPTIKSIHLMKYLIELLSMPNSNQVYLDPFAGSGTTLVACKKLNRKYIGIELSKEYCNIARARIEAII